MPNESTIRTEISGDENEVPPVKLLPPDHHAHGPDPVMPDPALPWHVEEYNPRRDCGLVRIRDANGACVAQFFSCGYSPADKKPPARLHRRAEGIVSAVNSHAALVSALDNILARWNALMATDGAAVNLSGTDTFTVAQWAHGSGMAAALDKAKAALALAAK